MKKWIALYLIGVLFTNSYIRIHRYGEWINKHKESYPSTSDHARQMDVNMSCLLGSVFWPLYVASKACDAIVSTKLKIEAPAILK